MSTHPPTTTHAARRIWTVDRYGRLLAGLSMFACTVVGLTVHPLCLWGCLLGALNLVISSVTNYCPFHRLLIRCGAREREDVFLPGGAPRSAGDLKRSRSLARS